MKSQLGNKGYLAVSVLGAVMWSGCGSSTPPTQTTTNTSTGTPPPVATSAPTDTTAQDNANAPQRKPPAGMGNAIGRVLFDGKGAPNIEVQLCEKLGLIGGCSGQTFQGKTDKDGYYVIDKVRPGEYSLAVRVFNTNKFIYPTAGMISAAKFKVEKDQSLPVRTVNLWKVDLQTESPKKGATVNQGKPKFSWKAYPNAKSYKVTVRTRVGAGASTTMETSETSSTPDKSLLNGDYEWEVEAFNAENTKIAETPARSPFKITGQAGSNTVDLVNPKMNTTVAGANLTLQWKAHPQADEYQVYLKGVKAKDAILSFETVKGTSHKLAAPLPADQYFWSVNAMADGEKIAGSELERFTVK